MKWKATGYNIRQSTIFIQKSVEIRSLLPTTNSTLISGAVSGCMVHIFHTGLCSIKYAMIVCIFFLCTFTTCWQYWWLSPLPKVQPKLCSIFITSSPSFAIVSAILIFHLTIYELLLSVIPSTGLATCSSIPASFALIRLREGICCHCNDRYLLTALCPETWSSLWLHNHSLPS